MQEKLDVRAVFRSVFEIYVDRASVLMPAAAVVSVVSGILWDVLAAAGPGTALLGEILSVIAIMWFTGIVVELAARVQRATATPRWDRCCKPSPLLWVSSSSWGSCTPWRSP
jgi:hypothetical protein